MCTLLFSCIIIFLGLHSTACSDEPKHIILTLRENQGKTANGTTCDSLQNYVLQQGVRNEVIIKSENEIASAKCSCLKQSSVTGILRYNTHYTMEIIDSNNLGSNWTCDFVMNHEDTVRCKFYVHYILKDVQQMYINNKRVETTRVDWATAGYDYTGRYLYDPDTTVNVTCKTVKDVYFLELHWDSANGTNILKNKTSFTNIISQNITLGKGKNNTTLSCIRNSISDDISLKIVMHEREAKISGDQIKIITISLAAGFAVILVVLIVLWIGKRKSRRVEVTPKCVQYGIFPPTNDAAKVADNVKIVNAEPVDVFNDTQYSVPYKPTIDELYTKPIPKSDRPRKNKEPEYAEINVHIQNDHNTASPSRNVYEDVVIKNGRVDMSIEEENQYSKVYAEPIPASQSNYGNISNNERYVNNDGRDDYAQPAYCELLIKRTKK